MSIQRDLEGRARLKIRNLLKTTLGAIRGNRQTVETPALIVAAHNAQGVGRIVAADARQSREIKRMGVTTEVRDRRVAAFSCTTLHKLAQPAIGAEPVALFFDNRAIESLLDLALSELEAQDGLISSLRQRLGHNASRHMDTAQKLRQEIRRLEDALAVKDNNNKLYEALKQNIKDNSTDTGFKMYRVTTTVIIANDQHAAGDQDLGSGRPISKNDADALIRTGVAVDLRKKG